MKMFDAYQYLCDKLPGRFISTTETTSINGRGASIQCCVEVDGETFCMDNWERVTDVASFVCSNDIVAFPFKASDLAAAEDPRR